MLAVPADRLPGAIGDLEPGNRALLDLSLRRGVSDAEIGELLRKEPADVARGRDAVLELLADALDVNGHDRRELVREAVAGLPDEAWRPSPGPPAPPPSAPPVEEPEPMDEEPEQSVDEEAPATASVRIRDERDRAAAARELDEEILFGPEEPKRSRRGGLFALLGLLAVVIVLIIVLSSGGDDDESDSASNGSQPADNGGPGPAPEGNSEKLTPIGNGKGEGTVTVSDEGATIVINGLPKPDGSYQVWLYNSIVDAQSLGTVSGGSGRVEVKLPPDASDYKSIDVSNEPPDANPNHSGASVLRAPLGNLLS